MSSRPEDVSLHPEPVRPPRANIGILEELPLLQEDAQQASENVKKIYTAIYSAATQSNGALPEQQNQDLREIRLTPQEKNHLNQAVQVLLCQLPMYAMEIIQAMRQVFTMGGDSFESSKLAIEQFKYPPVRQMLAEMQTQAYEAADISGFQWMQQFAQGVTDFAARAYCEAATSGNNKKYEVLDFARAMLKLPIVTMPDGASIKDQANIQTDYLHHLLLYVLAAYRQHGNTDYFRHMAAMVLELYIPVAKKTLTNKVVNAMREREKSLDTVRQQGLVLIRQTLYSFLSDRDEYLKELFKGRKYEEVLKDGRSYIILLYEHLHNAWAAFQDRNFDEVDRTHSQDSMQVFSGPDALMFHRLCEAFWISPNGSESGVSFPTGATIGVVSDQNGKGYCVYEVPEVMNDTPNPDYPGAHETMVAFLRRRYSDNQEHRSDAALEQSRMQQHDAVVTFFSHFGPTIRPNEEREAVIAERKHLANEAFTRFQRGLHLLRGDRVVVRDPAVKPYLDTITFRPRITESPHCIDIILEHHNNEFWIQMWIDPDTNTYHLQTPIGERVWVSSETRPHITNAEWWIRTIMKYYHLVVCSEASATESTTDVAGKGDEADSVSSALPEADGRHTSLNDLATKHQKVRYFRRLLPFGHRYTDSQKVLTRVFTPVSLEALNQQLRVDSPDSEHRFVTMVFPDLRRAINLNLEQYQTQNSDQGDMIGTLIEASRLEEHEQAVLEGWLRTNYQDIITLMYHLDSQPPAPVSWVEPPEGYV